MEEILRLRVINRLKEVERFGSVGKRKESAAEHSWSCLVLADYFLSKTKSKIDRLKVYELLMYHDMVEIETGDIPLHPSRPRNKLAADEIEAAEKLGRKLPKQFSEKFIQLFAEFLEQKTIEARFAKAVDQIESELHEVDQKPDWKGWTEEFLRAHKEKYVKEFPEISEAFEEITKFVRKEGYFDQKS
jgi:putative hydrolases of HD superfamily